VDIFPVEILEAYAYRLNWTPRPVLQSYSGYTPYLDQADASFYSGPGAPEYVLFSVGSIDGRNGLFDEPAAVRVLMDRYEPVRIQDEVLLLRRRTDAQTRKPLRRLGSVTMPLGSEIAVPSSPGHVYADIEVRNSLAGQALRVVFQTAAADIQFGYEDGTRSNPYRLVTATAKDGVLISDHVTSADQLAEVMKDGKPHPIRSFRVIPRRGFDYESLMSVTFYSDA
jgi:hypothetical protein